MTNLETINNYFVAAEELVANEYETRTEITYPKDHPVLFDGDKVLWRKGQDGVDLKQREYVIVSTDTGNLSYSFFKGLSRLDPMSTVPSYVEKDEQIVHFKTPGAISCDYEPAVMKQDAELYILDESTNIIEKEEFDRQVMRNVLSELLPD